MEFLILHTKRVNVSIKYGTIFTAINVPAETVMALIDCTASNTQRRLNKDKCTSN